MEILFLEGKSMRLTEGWRMQGDRLERVEAYFSLDFPETPKG